MQSTDPNDWSPIKAEKHEKFRFPQKCQSCGECKCACSVLLLLVLASSAWRLVAEVADNGAQAVTSRHSSPVGPNPAPASHRLVKSEDKSFLNEQNLLNE